MLLNYQKLTNSLVFICLARRLHKRTHFNLLPSSFPLSCLELVSFIIIGHLHSNGRRPQVRDDLPIRAGVVHHDLREPDQVCQHSVAAFAFPRLPVGVPQRPPPLQEFLDHRHRLHRGRDRPDHPVTEIGSRHNADLG